MKKLTVGIIAHVDAGKTTLSEALLYISGKIKTLGRVDHRSTVLDNNELERRRGITIFSKQAMLSYGGMELSLLDTPGHVDFSTEMERSLLVMDYAILVISGSDGVQAHTETLWRLLKRYAIPTFIFCTKMDLPGKGREELLAELKSRLFEGCMDFGKEPDCEELAMCSEELLEKYMDSGELTDGDIAELILSRKLCPCYFGSGLKLEGVEEFLEGFERYTKARSYPEEFGAKVYKIMRDAQGKRITCMKLTGGRLKVRMPIVYKDEQGEALEEKVSQIRLYSGAKFEAAEEVEAGGVCAVLGLSGTYPGQGLGCEKNSESPMLEPVLSYRLLLPKDCETVPALQKLRQLEEEDPQLHIVWNAQLQEIHIQLMGEIQTQVLKSIISERFGMDVEIDSGRIMYRETIKNKVEGVGHYEPLKHYSEVHLILQPLERGSGLVFDTICPEDELDRNWQRLILTHLAEKRHLGVLTGSPITDMRISLAAGKAHVKHTEGGDFRQSTYRAVRQGLMKAESRLLEPWYEFRLEVPPEQIGRAISDVRAMSGEFEGPFESGSLSAITGKAPVSEMREYASQVAAYTHGLGRFSCRVEGYYPCHDESRVVEAMGYDPEADLDNTPDSVFCAHGAGQTVKWNRVEEYMHLESCLAEKKAGAAASPVFRGMSIDERELEAIMEREFGPIKRPIYSSAKSVSSPAGAAVRNKREYLIVDGYNLIFAWPELKSLAQDSLDAARQRLMDILSNYKGFTKCELVLVFDAYLVTGGAGSRFDYHNIHVAYTKEGETGDAYIEKLSHDIGRNFDVRVVTSDNLIRLSALRAGVLRCSAGEFIKELEWTFRQIGDIMKKSNEKAHTTKIDFKGVMNGK